MKEDLKRVLIVDDHPVFRRGMVALVGDEAGLVVCGEADNAASALEAMRRSQPDLALLDISMPGTNGIELIKLMLAEQPKLQILVLSMHEETRYALRALRAGANGYVMKAHAMEHVVGAMHKVLKGDIYVSPSFSERLVFKAVQSLEVAQELKLSIKTIETHRAHIKEKLGFSDAGKMLRFAIDWVAQEKG
jgi:DNA-binding NarL/FixJ family response regulator